MHNRWCLTLGFTTLAPFLSLPSGAQQSVALIQEAPYVIPRLEGPIVIDGRIDEPAWEAIVPLPAVMHRPDFGMPPSERTEFRVAHDGEYLYFSCRAYVSDPATIQALSLERNETGGGSDTCAIYLDTANDEENALGFRTTPAGNRTDFHFTNDGGAANSNWDTFWETAVSSDEHGWYAEMQIPFSSLIYQVEDGRVLMGMSVLRMIAQTNERVIYPAIPPQWGGFSFAKASQMRKIVLEGVEEVRPLYFTPYTLAGRGYSHHQDAGRSGYERRTDRVYELGADMKYNLTSNLTLDLTVNTDFAQVEADDQEVNLTRFSLFFPEKRRFFLERGVNFDYSLGGQERLFHPRQVGLVRGEPVRIYGGARLVGRVGEWDVGALNMQTAESQFLPSENQGVVRLRRRVINPNSYIGGILTNRMAAGGRRNTVYGVDAIIRVWGDDYLVLNWAQSFDDREDAAGDAFAGSFDRSLVRLNWERRGADGLSYRLGLRRVGGIFQPRMGFLPRRDYQNADAGVGYGWRPGPGSALLSYGISVDGTMFLRNEDGTVETAELQPSATLETRRGDTLVLTVATRYENLEEGFVLPGNVPIPAGAYRFSSLQLVYRAPAGNSFRPNASVAGGQFFDGRRVSVSFGPSWSPSRHLRVDGTYRIDRVDFLDRGEGLTAHIGRLRTEVMVSTTTSATAFVQYNSSEDEIVANLRFRYNPREGNDFYIVWNEGLLTNGFDTDPTLPRSHERTVLLKYSRTLHMGF